MQIANNENGEIPEIVPTFDVHQLNFTETFVHLSKAEQERQKTTTTTTTEAPEVRAAMGYEVSQLVIVEFFSCFYYFFFSWLIKRTQLVPESFVTLFKKPTTKHLFSFEKKKGIEK